MLRSLKELFGYNIEAVDGEIGRVHDIYFDDEQWVTRYLVANTGPWILGRKVLIAPEALGQPNWISESFPVELTREDIIGSPDVKTALPVSKQQQIALHNYYSWKHYWVSPTPFDPTPIASPVNPRDRAEQEAVEQMIQSNSTLRSAQEIMGYGINGEEESLGKIDDLILNDETWRLHYLVLDTSTWLSSGKKTLIATHWIRWIDSRKDEINLDLTQQIIEDSPPFDPETPINRTYEEVVYDFYGKPYIWSEKQAEPQI